MLGMGYHSAGCCSKKRSLMAQWSELLKRKSSEVTGLESRLQPWAHKSCVISQPWSWPVA